MLALLGHPFVPLLLSINSCLSVGKERWYMTWLRFFLSAFCREPRQDLSSDCWRANDCSCQYYILPRALCSFRLVDQFLLDRIELMVILLTEASFSIIVRHQKRTGHPFILFNELHGKQGIYYTTDRGGAYRPEIFVVETTCTLLYTRPRALMINQ